MLVCVNARVRASVGVCPCVPVCFWENIGNLFFVETISLDVG